MLMEIKGIEKLYRIKRLTGSCYYVVTDSIEALAKYCVAKEKSGYLISSITEIQPNGSTPRVAIRSLPEYKKAQKEILTFKEFQETSIFKKASIIEVYDKHGYPIEIDWLKIHSYHLVLEHYIKNDILSITIDAD